MIFRYYVKCPGCENTLLIRLGVGNDTEQPFYFICENCNIATRGKQIIWYEPSPGAKIELEDGEQIPSQEHVDQTININPDLPSLPNVHIPPLGMPFMMNSELLGENFENYKYRYDNFVEITSDSWKTIRRIWSFYLDEKWQRFNNEAKKIFEDWPDSPNIIAKNDIPHRLFDHVFMPIMCDLFFVEMKQEWNSANGQCIKTHQEIYQKYISSVGKEKIIEQQMQLFHCVEQYVDKRSSFLPAFPLSMYDLNNKTGVNTDELRIFRDEFPSLRDLYIITFEACHKVLAHIAAINNIIINGDPNKFTSEKVKNLKDFEKKPNAFKIEHCTNFIIWQAHWNTIFDRKIRNAIGHFSIRHDLVTGLLISEKNDPITYLDFTRKTLFLIHPLMACLNVLKMMRIALGLRR